MIFLISVLVEARQMAHELDDRWTLFIAANDGSGNYDPKVTGTLFLKIAANGNVDRAVSRHESSDGSNELDGRVTPFGLGYRVHLFEHLLVGSPPIRLKRPFKGGLIARIGGQLVMGGVQLKDQIETIQSPHLNAENVVAIAGQEEGTWVATKP
jgi:hypothetical protein